MPYHHLTESHRRLIEDLHRAGNSNRALGQRMGRCHTTMGRELKRHSQLSRSGKNTVLPDIP